MNDYDLMLGVLSLTAYEKVATDAFGKVASIGGASRVQFSGQYADGFSAVTYQIGSQLVIAYRGSDDFADTLFGWPQGGGRDHFASSGVTSQLNAPQQ